MTYQQTSRLAVFKRIIGWLIFFPTCLSTSISLLNFMFTKSLKEQAAEGINSVMFDFIHVMTDMVRFHTPFLSFFWQNAPVPDFYSKGNIGFWIIYVLIFVGLALQSSGARMWRQTRRIKEAIDDQLLLERVKGKEGFTREQLEERIALPKNSVFRQFFPLYVLPIMVLTTGYLVLSLLGMV